MSQGKILLGPVVGRVTTSSAIILLELDTEISLECLLYENGAGAQDYKTSNVTFPKKSARVFQFNGLQPGMVYKFSVPQLHGDTVLGSFRTFVDEPADLRVAAVSCDRPKDNTGDMWASLASDVFTTDLVLHLGDNVYLDEDVGKIKLDKVFSDDEILNPDKVDQTIPYVKARKLLHNKDKAQWPEYTEQITEIFREKYRKTWTRKSKAQVLANTSNLMILDDHEVRDFYGDTEMDSDPSSKEYFLSTIAIGLYHEYQRQLWDPDIVQDAGRTLHNEFYSIEQGPLVITMLEPRTSKAIYKKNRDKGDSSYYGRQQWESFKEVVEKSSKARILLVASSVSLFFLNSRILRYVAEKHCCGSCCGYADAKDFIDYNKSGPDDKPTQELVAFLDLIAQWKQSRSLPSTALILSGEVHMGGFTDIYTEDKKSLVTRQISTGAISLKNLGPAEFAITNAALRFTDTHQNYAHRHYEWTKNSNYTALRFQLKAESLCYSAAIKHTQGTSKHLSVIDATHKEELWDKGSSGGCCQII